MCVTTTLGRVILRNFVYFDTRLQLTTTFSLNLYVSPSGMNVYAWKREGAAHMRLQLMGGSTTSVTCGVPVIESRNFTQHKTKMAGHTCLQ